MLKNILCEIRKKEHAKVPNVQNRCDQFVRLSDDGTHLCLGNSQPFYFCGTNCYYLMTRAADPSTFQDVIGVLNDVAASGNITVVRTWAFADGPQWNALQPSPGQFDERVFCALDRVIAEAGKRNLRLLFNLTNFWPDYGGMGQYMKWSSNSASESSNASEFYEDLQAQTTYFNFIDKILTRVNSITGIPYREDPTILGWAPANEPQCHLDPGAHRRVIAQWAHRAAAHIKNLDPNHLVFMDCEGFFGPGQQSFSHANPYDCTHNGCDFLADCSSKYIDVACFHLYPDLWLSGDDVKEESKTQFALNWIDAHVRACSTILRKPCVLSEYGKKQPGRSTFFKKVLEACLRHMQNKNSRFVGSIFWTAAARSYPDYDGFTVYLPRGSSDGARETIEHASAVQRLNYTPPQAS